MKKIYIIEDNEQLRKMYERTFRFGGYEVELASDGEEALKNLRKLDVLPDVIVMDVIMPKMSGLDLLQNIKNESYLKNIPVVVLTNSFLKENADQFLKLGADMYLVKVENSSNEVLEKVNKMVEDYSINKNNKV